MDFVHHESPTHILAREELSGEPAGSTRVPPSAARLTFLGPASVPDGPDLRAGQSLGRFKLVEQVGSGSFGTVWKAFDTLLERFVAVKVAHAPMAERLAATMLDEARLAAQLHHPNIVRVHELRTDAGTVFIVTDLVQGASLAQWLKSNRPSFRTAAAVCEQIARALQHAHDRGVIHRDLKPGNVMLSSDGQPCLVDFGLSRRRSGSSAAYDEIIVGTPAYMPPEQARGDTLPPDGRADIYSLGAILFEMLTGRPPFRGTTSELLVQLSTQTPPSPREFNKAIPRDLEQICLKCLRKRPEERYSSAAELADDLQRWQAGRPVRVRRLGAVRWILRPVTKHPVAAVTLVALLIVGVFAYRSAHRAGEAHSRLAITRAQAGLLRSHIWVDGIMAVARSPRYEEAIAEAKRLQLAVQPPARLYDLACVYALAADAASEDSKLSEARRKALADEYCRISMRLLESARQAGYFESPDRRLYMARDPHLSFLRQDPAFVRFVLQFKEQNG